MSKLLEQFNSNFKGKILRWNDNNNKRVYADINPSDILEMGKYIFIDLNMRYVVASAVDTREGIEVLYHFSDDSSGKILSLRAMITDKAHPKIDSLTGVITGISWIEREIHELFGIDFTGHPNQKHLLLGEDWPPNTYPMRHDNGRK